MKRKDRKKENVHKEYKYKVNNTDIKKDGRRRGREKNERLKKSKT